MREPVRRSVRELWLPPFELARHPHSQGKITHVRGHVRASVRWSRSLQPPLAPSHLAHTLTTCARFIPRELYDGQGLAWLGENFGENRAPREKNRTSNYSPSLFRFRGQKHDTVRKVNELFSPPLFVSLARKFSLGERGSGVRVLVSDGRV